MMIQGENLSLKLGGKIILRDISLVVHPGEYAVLMGPNGAGKSTLLKVLSLVQKPSSGRVIINKCPGEIKGKIGFLSHRSFLYERLTAWENLKFYGHLYQVPDLTKRVDQVIEQVGLSYYLHEPVFTYSRGMVQRLAIARMMLHDPEILFLDEPFTGLDQKGGAILSGIIGEMHRQGKTILMVTHSFDQGWDLVERVLVMKDGSKIFDDKISESDVQDIRKLYLSLI
ncbi:MAG: ABC transporter ATP-binding protein [Bacillota bacterium]|jgi:heme ABC exporter ATP-binding subunit CcmA